MLLKQPRELIAHCPYLATAAAAAPALHTHTRGPNSDLMREVVGNEVEERWRHAGAPDGAVAERSLDDMVAVALLLRRLVFKADALRNNLAREDSELLIKGVCGVALRRCTSREAGGASSNDGKFFWNRYGFGRGEREMLDPKMSSEAA